MTRLTLTSSKVSVATELTTTRPEYIDQKHWDEWVKDSRVSPDITARNVKSIHDPREIDELLNRNSKKRWKHSEELVPGWAVSGVNPFDSEGTYLGCQFKPNNPQKDPKSGKTQKYLMPTGDDAHPLFLEMEDVDFWLKVKSDTSIPVFNVEGPKKAGAVLSQGNAAISIPGVTSCRKKDRMHQSLIPFFTGRRVYLGFDGDWRTNQNVHRALISWGYLLRSHGAIPYVLVLPPDGPKGIDDFIAANGSEAYKELVENAPTFKEWVDEYKDLHKKQRNPDPVPNTEFNQKVFNFFFGTKPWICVKGKLYEWQGNYYKLVLDAEIKPKIAAFCNNYAVTVEDKQGNTRQVYPYAKTKFLNETFTWAKELLTVSPEHVNPPGINCTNGVVSIIWDGDKPSVKFEPHTPHNYFTYEPLVKYDPQADATNCERLLQCLDPEQQQVLLRNIAASIDMKNVRRLRGREVKALLCSGLGSNGKDALREVVSVIFGHEGMTGASLGDFAAYDAGRKFPLASLINSRINWSSENAQTERLDRIQSLKRFITGNLLESEYKGKDAIPFTPKGVGFFNVNETPALEGTMQATKDRFAILRFLKTFTKNPNPNNPNELLADPRFAYDQEFIKKDVAPAFLNKMLQAFLALISEGIDYKCTTEALTQIQQENNHLFQFCEDVGLVENPNSTITAQEIWKLLEKWYIDNEILSINEFTGNREWVPQARPSDKNLKGVNQVMARFNRIFPKAQKVKAPHPTLGNRKLVPALKGVGLLSISPNRTTTIENSTTTAPAVALPLFPTQQGSHHHHHHFSNPLSEKNKDDYNLSSDKNILVENPEHKYSDPMNSPEHKYSDDHEIKEYKYSENVDQKTENSQQSEVPSPETGGAGGASLTQQGLEVEHTGGVVVVRDGASGGANRENHISGTLKEGDKIKFYPNEYHKRKGWGVTGVVRQVEGLPITEKGIFAGCDVIYFDRKTNEERMTFIAGGMREWIIKKL